MVGILHPARQGSSHLGSISGEVPEPSCSRWDHEDEKEGVLGPQTGGMTITEYHDKFLQLSRYAQNEVAEDGAKQEHFMEGLNDALQYQLMNHNFPSFHDLVNRALLTERKRKDMDERKRKLSSTPSGSNTRYQQQHQQQYQPQGYQQRNQGQQGYQQRQE